MTQAIFFSGPIGAGKSTLGRAVAGRLGAAFLDGDDFADHRRPWYASSLGTSRSIATALLDALRQSPSAIVAYPLRCTNYVYFHRRMADAGHGLVVVSLGAAYEQLVHAGRGRVFSAGERARIAEMLAQGYGERPFSDLVVDTAATPFDATVALLVARLRPRLG
jgi:ABC-type protease/lipase transport system fused ATPase/permease subunit